LVLGTVANKAEPGSQVAPSGAARFRNSPVTSIDEGEQLTASFSAPAVGLTKAKDMREHPWFAQNP